MRNPSRLLILAVGLLAIHAVAQEIVIEPTNGRRPASQPSSQQTSQRPIQRAPADVKPVADKPAKPPKSTNHPAAQPHRASERAANLTPPAGSAPSASVAPELAKSDAPEPVPAPAKLPLRPAWALTDTRDARSLQHEIASALARDPKLAHAAIQIDVTDAEVTLTGTANGVEERLQAERLVQSYAWNRRVTDHIEVLPSISAQR